MKNARGFSLLEIMIALAILGLSLSVILNLHGTTMGRSLRAEHVAVATQLARLKLSEIRLNIEKEMSQGTFPSENKTLDGTFDKPYEDYRWKAVIKKVEIPIPPAPSPEAGEKEKKGDMSLFFTGFKMVAEQIGEATREIRVDIFWGESSEEEETISVATHIIKL